MKLISFFVLISISFYSYGEKTKQDQEMLHYGLIDKDFKYINIKEVADYFRYITNSNSMSLPVMFNSEEELIGMVLTPFNAVYSYKLHRNLSKKEIKTYAQLYNNPKRIISLCTQSFNNEFQWANNVIVKFKYIDLSGQFITEVRLDKEACQN